MCIRDSSCSCSRPRSVWSRPRWSSSAQSPATAACAYLGWASLPPASPWQSECDHPALETDELDRWRTFLSWLGVNQALRPVCFRDVEEQRGGGLRTRDLGKPEGAAFAERQHQGLGSRVERDEVERLEPVAPDRVEKRPCLVGGEWSDLMARHAGRLGESCGVAGHQTPAFRLPECLAEHRPEVGDGPRRESRGRLRVEERLDLLRAEAGEGQAPEAGREMDPDDAPR